VRVRDQLACTRSCELSRTAFSQLTVSKGTASACCNYEDYVRTRSTRNQSARGSFNANCLEQLSLNLHSGQKRRPSDEAIRLPRSTSPKSAGSIPLAYLAACPHLRPSNFFTRGLVWIKSERIRVYNGLRCQRRPYHRNIHSVYTGCSQAPVDGSYTRHGAPVITLRSFALRNNGP